MQLKRKRLRVEDRKNYDRPESNSSHIFLTETTKKSGSKKKQKTNKQANKKLLDRASSQLDNTVLPRKWQI